MEEVNRLWKTFIFAICRNTIHIEQLNKRVKDNVASVKIKNYTRGSASPDGWKSMPRRCIAAPEARCASWPPIPSNPHLLQPIFSNGYSSGMHARATVRSAPKQTMALNSPTVFQQQARSATLYEATAAELGICTTARWSAAIGRVRSDFILAIAFTR